MINGVKKIINNRNTKAGTFYIIGNIFDKGIAFLTIPLFTRLMTTTDYGIVNTYISWVAIMTLVLGLSLGSSIRSACIEYKGQLDQYISSVLFLSIINFIFISAIILLISRFVVSDSIYILIILCLIHSYMLSILNLIKIKYMMGLNYIKKTLLISIPNLVVVILSIIFLCSLDNNKYLGRIIAYVIVMTVAGGFYFLRYLIKERSMINKEYWKYAIRLSLPLIFHGLSMIILRTSDRTMITIFRSASETGVYSLVYNLSMITLVITTSIESVWIPWFNRQLTLNNKGLINKTVNLYIEIALVVMIGLLMISPDILKIIAPPNYWSGIHLIYPIIMSSFFIFLYSISVNLEYFYKKTKVIAMNTFLAALINIILNLIFIPLYGALGAAFTTLISYVISFVIHYNTARKIDNLLFPFKLYIKPLIILFIFSILSYIFMNFIILRWSISILGFVIYFIISIKYNRFTTIIKINGRE